LISLFIHIKSRQQQSVWRENKLSGGINFNLKIVMNMIMKIELLKKAAAKNVRKANPAKVSFKFNREKLLVQFSFTVHVKEKG